MPSAPRQSTSRLERERQKIYAGFLFGFSFCKIGSWVCLQRRQSTSRLERERQKIYAGFLFGFSFCKIGSWVRCIPPGHFARFDPSKKTRDASQRSQRSQCSQRARQTARCCVLCRFSRSDSAKSLISFNLTVQEVPILCTVQRSISVWQDGTRVVAAPTGRRAGGRRRRPRLSAFDCNFQKWDPKYGGNSWKGVPSQLERFLCGEIGSS